MAAYYHSTPHPALAASSSSTTRARRSSRPLHPLTQNYDYDYVPAPPPASRRSATLPSPVSSARATSTYTTIALDPLLEYHTSTAHSLLEYDLALPISQARLTSTRAASDTLSSRDRARPATSPPLPYMRLKSEYLPWSIEIHPAGSASYVTVGDVLEGIHRALRHHVSKPEWLDTSESTKSLVQASFYRRIGRSHSHREWREEYTQGLRRIDWVGRKTVFAGLRASRRKEDWVLGMRQAEKTVKFWAGS